MSIRSRAVYSPQCIPPSHTYVFPPSLLTLTIISSNTTPFLFLYLFLYLLIRGAGPIKIFGAATLIKL